MVQNPRRWLLLIHRVPAKPDYLRVKIARRLQRIGAQILKQAVYVLPLSDETREDFQWAMGEIKQAGGEAYLWEASAVAGISDGEIEEVFRKASEAAYQALAGEARALVEQLPQGLELRGDLLSKARAGVTRSSRRLDEIRAVDFFQAAGQGKAVGAITALMARAKGDVEESGERAASSSYTGKTWVTRSGVFIDRLASAWLIRRYIDPDAEFKFLPAQNLGKPDDNEVRFDMFEAEFEHEGDKCTFEVLCERFGISEPAVRAIGEIVHDIDLKENTFRRPEAAGVESLVRGIVQLTSSDGERLEQGIRLFDQLRLALAQEFTAAGKDNQAGSRGAP